MSLRPQLCHPAQPFVQLNTSAVFHPEFLAFGLSLLFRSLYARDHTASHISFVSLGKFGILSG